MVLTDLPGTRWMLTEDIREDAPVRLFCFAGTADASSEFMGWSDSLGAEDVECYCVQLPGGGSRRYEPVLSDAEALVHALVTEMVQRFDKPFAFYGRHTGSQVCLALALELQTRGLAQPRRVFVRDCPQKLEASEESMVVTGCASDGDKLSASLQAFVRDKGLDTPLACPVTYLWPSKASGKPRELDLLNRLAARRVETVSYSESHDHGNSGLIEAVDSILAKEAATSRKESVQLVGQWNSQTQNYPDTSCLHDMFRESAKKNRDSVAIVYQGSSLTFGEVDDLTDSLAGWLYAKGVRVGSTVGIFMEHRAEYALAYIAAHKATGAYMPLELVYPADLLEGVLKEVKPTVILTQKRVEARLPSWQLSLCMDDDGEWMKVVAEAPPVPQTATLPSPDDLAYVVMSSGTTGAPKGICCPHRGAVHSYFHRLKHFPYAEGDREACHVFFVWELLRPLLGGMDSAGGVAVPLYVIPDDSIYDPNRLLRFLGENAITRMLFTPSLLQLVLDQGDDEALREGMKTMRIVWLCGEVVTVELRNKFKDLFPKCHLENLYSISECHDISYCNLDDLDVTESPKYAPCGKVVPNVRAYVLDEELKQVPVGVPGRMWIAGPTLAIGYLNMPEKTAQRFVPDPFAPRRDGEEGQLMYDTGDRCRYLSSGSIEVIGRCDYMVKVRGYSVVIGAVEAAITEHPLVSTAVVMTEGAEGSMDKHLVAYIVPESWEKLPSVRSIQQFLKSRLPPYAIPHVCILLDAVPINLASGKTDKKKLPRSDADKVRFVPHSCAHDDNCSAGGETSPLADTWLAEEGEEEPTASAFTPTQRTLAGLWARLLKVDESTITVSSDFFDLGGHSLLLAKLVAAFTKEAGVSTSIASVVERPTLAEMAQLLEKEMIYDASAAEAVVGLSTPAQRVVGQAWARVLEPSADCSFSAETDFFDAGGHSLLLAKLASVISQETGISLTIQNVVDHPKLGEMALLVEEAMGGSAAVEAALALTGDAKDNEKVSIDPPAENGMSACGDVDGRVMAESPAPVANLEAEARRLDPSIYPAPTRKVGYARYRASMASRRPQRVFLTGASGFVGAHILASLLRDTSVDVFCLVRAVDEEGALLRLERTLKKFKLLEDHAVASALDRIVAVPGDLSRPLFGLDDAAFKMLAAELDSIIHSGASVNLLRSYKSLKAVNVLGTQEVLRLAVTNAFGTRVKPVHFVSTNGVFPFSSENKILMESADMSQLWRELTDGYAQSKWVAEQMCVEARRRGLPVSILRPGNMSPSSITGAWNKSDFIYVLLQGCVELGCVPEGVSWCIDMTPVDFAARAMVHVSVEQPEKGIGKVLHIQNPGDVRDLEDIVDWVAEATGVELARLKMQDFRARLASEVDKKGQKDAGVLSQLEAGLDGFAYYLSEPPKLDCAGLTQALEGSDIRCQDVDRDLIGVYASTLTAGRE